MVQNQKLRFSTSLGRRSEGQEWTRAGGGMIEYIVHSVDQHRHPSDPTFRDRNRQPGEAEGHPRPQPLGGSDERVDRKEGRQQFKGRRGRRKWSPGGSARVQAHNGPGLLAGANSGSQWW